LREAQIETIKVLLENCYHDEEITMPPRIYHILFKKDFNDLPGRQVNTTTDVAVTDIERRTAFINEINIILSKRSKEKQHLLPSVILQLIRLRFPNELDKYKPPNSGMDVSMKEFVQWTMHVK
jgi:hypothetical protein